MNRSVEKYSPISISILTIVVVYIVDQDFLNKIHFSNFLNSTQVVFSVLLGFLLTVSTLLHTIDNRKMRLIKTADQYSDLSSYLKYSIYLNFAVTALSLFIPLVKNSILNMTESNLIAKYIFLFLVLYALFASVRFIRLFLIIIGSSDK